MALVLESSRVDWGRMPGPYYQGSRVGEEAGRRKTGSRHSEAQRLEGKRQEKAFEQAMIKSPMGVIYEAQPAAEPGKSVIFKTMNSVTGELGSDRVFSASVVEVLKPEFFNVASETRSEDYQHPIPRLKKDKVKRGYAHHGKPENLGVWRTVMAKTKDEWTFVHITFPSEDHSDSDLDVVWSLRAPHCWVVVSLSLSSCQYCCIEYRLCFRLFSLSLSIAVVESEPNIYCQR